MKKKKWVVLAMMLVLVFFAACDNPKESAMIVTSTAGMEEHEAVFKTAGVQADEIKMEYAYTEPKELVVYYSNGKANGLKKEILQADEMTPETVISSLSRHNIVSIDTKVLDFEAKEANAQGRIVLELNLSKAYGEYLKTMGEGGEKVAIAALANTFLENYQADALILRVEGEKLETDRGIYEEELIFKELEFEPMEEGMEVLGYGRDNRKRTIDI